jgi:NhaA family Na+:H+ antiporter
MATTEAERAGPAAAVLLAATVAALAWANSPWPGSYRSVFDGAVRHWVNDALMAVFFLSVGLEIKSELVHGRLRDRRTAAMPAVAALGGMVMPAALFALVNARGPGARGWGIPMATDIAFAMGVIALLGPRVPRPLRLFLLTLAVVDDVGAIVVIAVFYAAAPDPRYLGAAIALVVLIALVNRAGVARPGPYLLLGAALWLATYRSGVHPTIAGVALGLLMPVRPTRSPAGRLATALAPWSAYVVVPVFALANAGVVVASGSFGAGGAAAVSAGVVVGLVAGKTLGITGAAWLATRTGIGRLPEDATWQMIWGVAAIGGVGFTVALFVAGLAYPLGPVQDAAKMGVLAGSTIAAVAGGLLLARAVR